MSINPFAVPFGGSLGASGRPPPFSVPRRPVQVLAIRCRFRDRGDANDDRHRTRERPQTAGSGLRDRLCPGSRDHRRPGADGSPDWHRHGRGRRRHFWRSRPDQLASTHWRGVDDEDRRAGGAAIPEPAAWIVHARCRPGRIPPVSRRRHSYWGRGHDRTNACPQVGSARGLDRGARIRLSPGRPRTLGSELASAPRTSTRSP